MESLKLSALRELQAQRHTKAFLVIRHDRIVCEWYADGYGPTRKHYTASLAKALVGGMSLMVALNDGRIGLDDHACQYIPSWRKDPLKAKITIRHLATHSSGIEDAEIAGKSHAELTGWKGAFWRRDPDPFSVALNDAPVMFDPGAQFAYSNPGMAALAYAVTVSLKNGPQSEIQSLLKERVMDPIGVPDNDWSIGYGRAYLLDGIKLYANWGGGEYTARAIARVGQLVLHNGEWQGRQLVHPAWVKRMVTYDQDFFSGMPQDSRRFRPALGWWTNSGDAWPALPQDAFCGIGAGNQVLLIVPSLDLIAVRSGDLLIDSPKETDFWEGLRSYLFEPVSACLKGSPQGLRSSNHDKD